MIAFAPPSAPTNSGRCNEKRCEACTWAECSHSCHAPPAPLTGVLS